MSISNPQEGSFLKIVSLIIELMIIKIIMLMIII